MGLLALQRGGKADTGIDLVARRTDDVTWTAIQCKFYKPTTSIQKANLDFFFEASGRTFETEDGVQHFGSRLIISTTDRWSSNAEEMLTSDMISRYSSQTQWPLRDTTFIHFE